MVDEWVLGILVLAEPRVKRREAAKSDGFPAE